VQLHNFDHPIFCEGLAKLISMADSALGRTGQPEDIAGIALFLASHELEV
jgi:NAD(P)-dependent dehydrogenase (short-subunit alcohol dehydrogenase family)